MTLGDVREAFPAVRMPEDDPRERQRKLGSPVNAALVRAVGTDLMTMRIDLDPDG
jgi:hypothetical protein